MVMVTTASSSNGDQKANCSGAADLRPQHDHLRPAGFVFLRDDL